MLRSIIKMNSLSGVSNGSKATLKFNRGFSYEFVKFTLTNITPAQMLNVTLKINGRPVQSWLNGSDIQAINNQKGRKPDSAGYLTYWFVKPELKELLDQRIFKLGMADVNTAVLEFDIHPDAVDAEIEASAMVSADGPLGIITKVLNFSRANSSTGLDEIDNIPHNGARWQALHFHRGDIEHIEIRKNNRTAFEAARVESQEYQKDYGRVPQAGWSHVDFLMEGDSAGALVTNDVNDLRVKLRHASTGQMAYYVEYTDVFDGGV